MNRHDLSNVKHLFVHIPKNGGMTIRKEIGGSKGGNKVLVAEVGFHISPEYTKAVQKMMDSGVAIPAPA